MTRELTPEQFYDRMRTQQAAKNVRLEELRKAIEVAPVPLSDELAKKVIWLISDDAHAVMRSHPGYKLAQRVASYRTALSVMESSLADLIRAIDEFMEEAGKEKSHLMGLLGEQDLEGFERRIQKELFAVANAAASLVDHFRRIWKSVELAGWKEKQVECFRDDGLHDFIKVFRNLIDHNHLFEANWQVNYDFEKGTKAPAFVLDRQRLLIAIDENLEGKERNTAHDYVTKHQGNISLKPMFEGYRLRMRRFYAWFDEQLASPGYTALRDYERVMREQRNRAIRQWWNILLDTALKNASTVDPHSYLPERLSAEQIAEVNTLPRNSREQVDLIIEYVDKENAIDDKLRDMAYRLFESVPVPQAAGA